MAATKQKVRPKQKGPELPAVPKGWTRREQPRGKFWSPWATDEDVDTFDLVSDNPIEGTIERWRVIRSRGGRFGDKQIPVVDIKNAEHGLVTVKINGNLPGKLGETSGLGAGEEVSVRWLGKEEPSKDFPQGVHRYDVLTRS